MNRLDQFFAEYINMCLDLKKDYLNQAQSLNSIQAHAQHSQNNGQRYYHNPPAGVISTYELVQKSSIAHLKLPGQNVAESLKIVSEYLKNTYRDVLVVLHTLHEVKALRTEYPEFTFASCRQVCNWGGSAQKAPSKADFVIVVGYMDYEDHLRNAFIRFAGDVYDNCINDPNYLILFMG